MKKSLLLVVTPLAYNEYWVTRTKPPPQPAFRRRVRR